MLSVALVLAGIVGALTMLKHAESKPLPCPSCGARTLIADRNGRYWQCVPCEAQFIWFGTELIPLHGERPHDVPAAKLRGSGDRDKV